MIKSQTEEVLDFSEKAQNPSARIQVLERPRFIRVSENLAIKNPRSSDPAQNNIGDSQIDQRRSDWNLRLRVLKCEIGSKEYFI